MNQKHKICKYKTFDGFDRFKNGIIVDNFTGHGIGDVTDNDYSVSMDMAQGELRFAFHQDNIGLSEIQSDLSTAMVDTSRDQLMVIKKLVI